MGLSLIAGLAAAGLAVVSPDPNLAHDVRHDHQGQTVDARYEGAVKVDVRQKGMAGAPGRMGTQQCHWSAAVNVARRIADAPPAPVSSDVVMTGFRPGDCLAVTAGIKRDVARRHSELKAHVVTVAENDRPALIATRGGSMVAAAD